MTPPPDGLHRRGAALWLNVTGSMTLDLAGQVLLEEACRIADRLDRLHRMLSGDAACWAQVELPHDGDDQRLVLVINDAMTEARQQAGALRQLLAQLKLGKVAAPTGGRSSRDDLRARRTARRAAAAGAVGAGDGDELGGR